MTASHEPSTALDATSLRTGAVIAFGEDDTGATGDAIVDAIDSEILSVRARQGNGDRWLVPGVPALSREPAWIIPLSWEPPTSSSESAILRDRATQLWSDVRGACENGHGVEIGIDLVPESEGLDAYAAELARTGARRADWWDFGDRAVVLVVYGPPIPQPKTKVALHVVPRQWVWDDAARDKATATDFSPGDLSWSWADVVSFAGSH